MESGTSLDRLACASMLFVVGGGMCGGCALTDGLNGLRVRHCRSVIARQVADPV